MCWHVMEDFSNVAAASCSDGLDKRCAATVHPVFTLQSFFVLRLELVHGSIVQCIDLIKMSACVYVYVCSVCVLLMFCNNRK